MASDEMHAGERDVDAELARRLVDAQFPDWAAHSIDPVASDGTDNVMFRLGEDLSLRFPRIGSAAEQIEKEQRWLPELGPRLPLETPVPVAVGEPGEGYPWRWSVCKWVDGERATDEHAIGRTRASRDLADFVAALRRVDTMGGPAPGAHNFERGVPLAQRDAAVRDALEQLEGVLDAKAAAAAWEEALGAPAWGGPPVWIHGDLHPGNLIVRGGLLAGVIDFGGLAVGDPACDVMAAWTFLAPEARPAFRDALDVDDATWSRGRGWALSMGLIALPYYRTTNPGFAGEARRWIDEVLAECAGGL